MRVRASTAHHGSLAIRGLVLVALAALVFSWGPSAGAGGRRSPGFPASVVAPVLASDLAPELAVVAIYRDPDTLDSDDPTVIVEFADRFDLPESGYRLSVYVGDPGGEQTRVSLTSDGGDTGLVERSSGDGTFSEAGTTDVDFDRLTASLTIPGAMVPASGSLWVEADAGEGKLTGTPLFPLAQVLQLDDPGALTASDVVLLPEGPADLTASPTVEIADGRLTVTYTEAPPTEVGGNPLQSVVDVVRIAPTFDDSGQARYQLAIDNGAGSVALFDNQSGFPVGIPADPAQWLVQGLDGGSATAGTVIEADLDGLFQALGFTPDGADTAIGIARSLTIDESRAVRADGALGTLDWFEGVAAGSGTQGAAASSDGSSDAGSADAASSADSSGSSDFPLPLALAIGAILVVAVAAWVIVRRGPRGSDAAPLRLGPRPPESPPPDLGLTPAEEAEVDELTVGLFGDDAGPPGQGSDRDAGDPSADGSATPAR